MPRDAVVLKIQEELSHPKCSRKVSGLSRNGPQSPSADMNLKTDSDPKSASSVEKKQDGGEYCVCR